MVGASHRAPPVAVLSGLAQVELFDGGAVEGLPGRRCRVNVHFLAMSCRCHQARSVVGVTVKAWRRRSHGTNRVSVASRIRSVGS